MEFSESSSFSSEQQAPLSESGPTISAAGSIKSDRVMSNLFQNVCFSALIYLCSRIYIAFSDSFDSHLSMLIRQFGSILDHARVTKRNLGAYQFHFRKSKHQITCALEFSGSF